VPPPKPRSPSELISAELERIERERVRLLVAADIEAASALHADDFQLITPSGHALSKAVYLDSVRARDIHYSRWEPGSMEVRAHGDGAAVRYRAEMEMRGVVRQLWHTDVYERRDGRWQVVWSQATWIDD
jgi:hypothetical protein